MILNFGKPCSKCGVGFYLEIKQETPRIVTCYNCEDTLPYVQEDSDLEKGSGKF